MQRWQMEGIKEFRRADKRFDELSDSQLKRLYNNFSEETACASWVTVIPPSTEAFINWAFNSPFEKLKKRSADYCKIEAAEITFLLTDIPLSELDVLCQDIWDHPECYGEGPFNDDWYDFLKLLWVTYPDGKCIQLADLINKGK